MMLILTLIGSLGFIGSLFVMYRTDFGIPGIQKFDPGFRLLDMRFHYNPNEVYSTFNRIGLEGVIAYQDYLIVDFTFIAFFLILMFVSSIRVTQNLMARNILLTLACLRALLDCIENSILIYLLKAYPVENIQVAELCSGVTTLKFLMLYGWVVLITLVLLQGLIGKKHNFKRRTR